MLRRPPRATRTDTLFPYPTLFRSIFGYRSVDINYLFDLDGTPLRLIQSQQTTRTEQITNELQASGKLFDSKLNWIVGGFYLDDRPTGINGQALAVLSPGTRSEERRVGKECGSKGRYRWWPMQ